MNQAQVNSSGVGVPQVSGQVHYNGHTKDQFVVERTTAFVDQVGHLLAALR